MNYSLSGFTKDYLMFAVFFIVVSYGQASVSLAVEETTTKPKPLQINAGGECLVTNPPESDQRIEKERYGTNYRNDYIGVQLNNGGVTTFPKHDFDENGFIFQKYHVMTYKAGILKGTGRLIGSESETHLKTTPVIRSNPDGFVPFGAYFSSPGCWEITFYLVTSQDSDDKISQSELKFTTLVRTHTGN